MFEKRFAKLGGGNWTPCTHRVYEPFCSECVRKQRVAAVEKSRSKIRCVHGRTYDESCVACDMTAMQRVIDTAAGPGLSRQCINGEFLGNWSIRPPKKPREMSFFNEPALKDAEMIACAAPEPEDEKHTTDPHADSRERIKEINTEAARSILRLLKEKPNEWETSIVCADTSVPYAKHVPTSLKIALKTSSDFVMTGTTPGTTLEATAATATAVHSLSLTQGDPTVYDELVEALRFRILDNEYKRHADQAKAVLEILQKQLGPEKIPYKQTAQTGVGTVLPIGGGSGLTYFDSHYLMDQGGNYTKIEVAETLPKGVFTPRKKKVSWLKVFARSFAVAAGIAALFMVFAPAEWVNTIVARVYALVAS